MEEKKLSNNDMYILEEIKYLKYHGVTAYKLMKMSMTCERPISYPTIKKIYARERLPEKHDVYLGFLEAIYKVVEQIKKNKT